MKKRQALHTALAKQTPDAATAVTLQKGISDLQAQYDQMRLTLILKMKKIDPNFVEGPGMGHGWVKVLPAAKRKRPIKDLRNPDNIIGKCFPSLFDAGEAAVATASLSAETEKKRGLQ